MVHWPFFVAWIKYASVSSFCALIIICAWIFIIYTLRTFSMRRRNQFTSHLVLDLVSCQGNKKIANSSFFIKKMIGSWTWTSTQKIFSHIFHSHIRATARRWAVTTAAFWATPPFPFVPLPAAGRSRRRGYTIQVVYLYIYKYIHIYRLKCLKQSLVCSWIYILHISVCRTVQKRNNR